MLFKAACGFSAALLAWPALAEPVNYAQFTGVLRLSGHGLNSTLHLVPAKTETGPSLCSGDLVTRMRRITGMTLAVSGTWQVLSEGESCLQPMTFKVLKSATGGQVQVGFLSAVGGSIRLTPADAPALLIEDAPEGLRGLIGQQVIVEVNRLDGPNSKSTTYKVVGYSAFP